MNLAIIDYKSGNVRSVIHSLNRLGVEPILTDDLEKLKSADKIIFPGVGEASAAMQKLQLAGLDKLIPQLKQPVLGICLGMQLMCRFSEESDTNCLGIFPMEVKKFISEKEKIPHVGWNQIKDTEQPLFSKFSEGNNYYFVHSYYISVSQYTNSICDYIQPFSAGIQKDNFYGVQFHPEKSDQAGNDLLKKFLEVK